MFIQKIFNKLKNPKEMDSVITLGYTQVTAV